MTIDRVGLPLFRATALARRVGSLLRGIAMVALLGAATHPPRADASEPAGPALTVILVRHGEKESSPPGSATKDQDPDLTPAGRERAELLARVLADANVSAIFATHFKRTQQTVRPLAEKLKLAPTVLDAGANADLVQRLRALPAGAVALVAGHDASLPEVIAGLGGPKIDILPSSAFDRLLVLTVPREGSPTLVRLRYGRETLP